MKNKPAKSLLTQEFPGQNKYFFHIRKKEHEDQIRLLAIIKWANDFGFVRGEKYNKELWIRCQRWNKEFLGLHIFITDVGSGFRSRSPTFNNIFLLANQVL